MTTVCVAALFGPNAGKIFNAIASAVSLAQR